MVLVTLLAVLLCMVVGFGLTVLGWASLSLGWLIAALAFGVVLVGAALLIKTSRPRVFAAGAAVLALLLGLGLWWSVPPSPERVRAAAERLDVPEAWEVKEVDESGNVWCFKGCPSVRTMYRVPGDAEQERDALISQLEDEGWKRISDMNSMPRLADGRWIVTLHHRESDVGDGEPVVSATVE